jgi:large subunit ribosomal protein L25
MELRKIPASARSEAGKESARRIRRQGMIPAIAYGKQLAAQSLAVSPKDLLSIIKSEHGINSVIELKVEGQDALTVLLNDFQYHPVTRDLLHADFLQIHLDRPVDVDVPFELTGKAKGVVLGGTLRQVFRKLPIRCLPDHIPVKIQHDVTELELDAHVAVRDLKLPEGVTIRLPAERTVAAVVTESKRGEEELAASIAPGAAEASAAAPGADKKAAPAADKKADKKA